MEVNHTHAVESMRRGYRLIRRYESQRRATSADGERQAGATRERDRELDPRVESERRIAYPAVVASG